MQIERLRRVTAKEPIERIRRSSEAPDGAFGVVDKSGLILADAAEKAAAQFAATTQRRQDEWDKAKVNEALNSLYSEDNKVRYDPEKGMLLTINGANAKGLYEKSDGIYGKITQDISGKLENDKQRKMFNESSAAFIRSARTSISQHEAVEVRKYTIQQNEYAENNAAIAFAHNFNTPEGAEAAISAAQQSALTTYGDAAKGFSVPDFSGKYNTVLSEKEEQAFQKWLKAESEKRGRDLSKDLFDYDLRGLFKEKGGFNERGHSVDTYKKPNHPTFSAGSVYSNGNQMGGEWIETNGKWKFKPSDFNISIQSLQELKNYFAENGSDAELELTDKQAASREPLNFYVREKMAKITSLALNVLVKEDPTKAEVLLKSTQNYFDGVDYAQLKEAVDKAALPVKLQQDTPALFQKYGYNGQEAAIQEIRDNYSGAEEEKRVEYAQSLWRDKWTDRKFKEDLAVDNILGMMEKGDSLTQVNDAIKAVPWSSNGAVIAMKRARDEHFKIGEYAPKVKAPKMDPNVAKQLDMMRSDGSLFKEYPDFASFNAAFGSLMTFSEWKRYKKYYSDKKDQGNGKPLEPQMKMKYDSVYGKKLDKLGIKDDEERAFYYDRWNQDWYDMQGDPKRTAPLTNQDALVLMDRELTPVVIGEEVNWLGVKKDVIKRRAELPFDAKIEKGADGKNYVVDGNGKFRPLAAPPKDKKPDKNRTTMVDVGTFTPHGF